MGEWPLLEMPWLEKEGAVTSGCGSLGVLAFWGSLTDFPSLARAIRVEKRDKATDIIWTGIACQSVDVGIPDVESHTNCIICVEV